jgi:hypothetical protein
MSGHALPGPVRRYYGFGLHIFHITVAQRLLHVLSFALHSLNEMFGR